MVDGQKNGWMFREKVKPSLGSAKCSKNEFLQLFYFFFCLKENDVKIIECKSICFVLHLI